MLSSRETDAADPPLEADVDAADSLGNNLDHASFPLEDAVLPSNDQDLSYEQPESDIAHHDWESNGWNDGPEQEPADLSEDDDADVDSMDQGGYLLLNDDDAGETGDDNDEDRLEDGQRSYGRAPNSQPPAKEIVVDARMIDMDADKVDAIKSIMAALPMPPTSIPEWAHHISEDDWMPQLTKDPASDAYRMRFGK
ncbi:uncharacterized protein BJ171DRAFT_505888 [Polychytrium aggregatum]|uniref:uncharacterized protein n=1 Tax=Polychytrium aggregatum TaxID=110093 RepID=UPI0022FEC943|nr:uncharacterized protein BJ171DRAFT_505888 [Polychytrium aggregatum]KAI9204465.1 hypothetical protein BJ171DRAFT_505888 [Polychytrium aggregatum]